MEQVLEKEAVITDGQTDDFALDIRVTTYQTPHVEDGFTSVISCACSGSCSCVTCQNDSCFTCVCNTINCPTFTCWPFC